MITLICTCTFAWGDDNSYSVVSYKFLKDEISLCASEISSHPNDILFRLISSEAKVRNLIAEIRIISRISTNFVCISFAQYCMVLSEHTLKGNGDKLVKEVLVKEVLKEHSWICDFLVRHMWVSCTRLACTRLKFRVQHKCKGQFNIFCNAAGKLLTCLSYQL